jgi:hypothetical protein
MMTSKRGGTLVLAVVLGGCAASAAGGARVRTHTTTAAFQRYTPTQDAALAARVERGGKESPRARACRSGSSKTCNELGDGLVIKHAEKDAQQWYETSCERVRGSMVPNATRLMGLTQDLARLDADGSAGARQRAAELKSDVSEIKARIQGCLDMGDILKADGELKQSLRYFDAVCEFSTLVQSVVTAMPSLENTSANGCAAGAQARAALRGEPAFTPGLFADLTKQKKKQAADEQTSSSAEEGMVFSEADL